MTAFPRVTEAEAEGKVKSAFDDIKTTLGVATVGSIFEQLAVYPWFLQLAWRNLKPNAAAVCFHRVAGEVEAMSRQATGGHRRRSADSTPESPIEARLDLDAKLLVSTAALRYGINGQLPRMLWMSADEKQQASITATSTSPADEPEPAPDSEDARGLRRHAALAAESLPYRMEISATACRQSGLSEEDIDGVRAVLNAAWDILPRRLLAAAAAQKASAQSEPVAAA